MNSLMTSPTKAPVSPEMAAFENLLLDHVDLCYMVALKLTDSPRDAAELARYVLTWAWQLRHTPRIECDLKAKLLSTLRKTYLSDYRTKDLELDLQPIWTN